jgi:hypothetical protein
MQIEHQRWSIASLNVFELSRKLLRVAVGYGADGARFLTRPLYICRPQVVSCGLEGPPWTTNPIQEERKGFVCLLIQIKPRLSRRNRISES